MLLRSVKCSRKRADVESSERPTGGRDLFEVTETPAPSRKGRSTGTPGKLEGELGVNEAAGPKVLVNATGVTDLDGMRTRGLRRRRPFELSRSSLFPGVSLASRELRRFDLRLPVVAIVPTDRLRFSAR